MFAKAKLTYQPIPLPHRFDWAPEKRLSEAGVFHDHMKKRHSVRDFAPDPIPQAIIEKAVRTAGTAPSGANHQPWHFVAVCDPAVKSRIRAAAEAEEEEFYSGGGGEEWLRAIEPVGTDSSKPHLDIAPWLIVIFAQRYGVLDDGTRFKNYYVPESVGIATGFLIAALHHAGLATLTHTPNPMKFLNRLLDRPASEKPVMILAVGCPAADATVPAAAKQKKPLKDILSIRA